MTLLAPGKKIPMQLWWDWSDVVYDQMGIVSNTLGEHGRTKEADFFRHYRNELKELWESTRGRPDADKHRHHFATIYRSFLRELPETARTLQCLLDEDWRGGVTDDDDRAGRTGKSGDGGQGGFRTMRGKQIFGYPDYDNPRGIADGYARQGYLPYVMRNMIKGQTGFLYLGALKPRRGVTSSSGTASGYDAVSRENIEYDMMRRTFAAPRPT